MLKKSFKEVKRTWQFTATVSKDVIRPSAEECRHETARAISTKMRWAIRSDLEI